MDNIVREINVIDGISKMYLYHANKYLWLNLQGTISLKIYIHLIHASLGMDGFKQLITRNLDKTLKGETNLSSS